jgi:3-dehydroquinate synthase
VKTAVVKRDPYEQGPRRSLNFGHTIGHALEARFMSKKGRSLTHGEAVAAGMVAEAYMSFAQRRLAKDDLHRITQFIGSHFDLPAVPKRDFDELAGYMRQDKKNSRGRLRLSLLQGIGACRTGCEADARLVKRALAYYNDSLEN